MFLDFLSVLNWFALQVDVFDVQDEPGWLDGYLFDREARTQETCGHIMDVNVKSSRRSRATTSSRDP
jgi:hypothetical protein